MIIDTILSSPISRVWYLIYSLLTHVLPRTGLSTGRRWVSPPPPPLTRHSSRLRKRYILCPGRPREQTPTIAAEAPCQLLIFKTRTALDNLLNSKWNGQSDNHCVSIPAILFVIRLRVKGHTTAFPDFNWFRNGNVNVKQNRVKGHALNSC